MSDPRDEKRARKAAFDCGSAFLTHGLPGRAGPDEGEVECYEIILHALAETRRESLRVEMLGYYEQQVRAEAAEREIKRLKAQLRPHRKGPIVAGVGVPLCDACPCGEPWPCTDSTRISG